MALNPPRFGQNFGTRGIKAPSVRLADVSAGSTIDYAEIMVGDGPPAGGYGRDSGASLMYLDKTADSASSVAWFSRDGGTSWISALGIAIERYTLRWIAGQRGKPSLNADIQSATEATREIADPDFELLGTNAASSCSAYSTGGGITMTTTTASGDQVILVPHLDASQSAWGSVYWPTGKSLVWEALIETDSAITSQIVWAGLKLTNTSVVATDDDQVFVRYEAGVNSGKFQIIDSIGGTDTTTDSGVTVAVSTRYHLRIVINSSRVAKVYINGTLVRTTSALTSGNLIPYIGVQTATTAAKSIRVLSQSISRLY